MSDTLVHYYTFVTEALHIPDVCDAMLCKGLQYVIRILILWNITHVGSTWAVIEDM